MTCFAPRSLSKKSNNPKTRRCNRRVFPRLDFNSPIDIAGQRLGIKEVDDGIWIASFMHYDLAYFDLGPRGESLRRIRTRSDTEDQNV